MNEADSYEVHTIEDVEAVRHDNPPYEAGQKHREHYRKGADGIREVGQVVHAYLAGDHNAHCDHIAQDVEDEASGDNVEEGGLDSDREVLLHSMAGVGTDPMMEGGLVAPRA